MGYSSTHRPKMSKSKKSVKKTGAMAGKKKTKYAGAMKK